MNAFLAFAPAIDLKQLQKDIRKALRQYGRTGRYGSIPYLKSCRASWSGREEVTSGCAVLETALAQLHREDSIRWELLQVHLIEGEPMSTARRVGDWGESTAYREQQYALRRLAEIVLDIEKRFYHEIEVRFLHRVAPAATGRVFGIEQSIRRLQDLLFDAKSHSIVLIEGVGGIGKTTLAERVALQAMVEGRVADLGWVSARTARFTVDGALRPLPDPLRTTSLLLDALTKQLLENEGAPPLVATLERQTGLLQQRLKREAYLLVFDNIETVTDLDLLLPTLRKLAAFAPVLLTSRTSLPAESDVYHYRVEELRKEDARKLVDYEAERRGVETWRQAASEDFEALYEAVGGNPLALKLVVGQLRYHALADILADVRAARGESVKEMYRYIYQRAWNQLSEVEKTTLLAMPMVAPRPGNVETIIEATGLSAEVVRDALQQLVDLNLVERRGDLQESFYTIHSLTRAFLEDRVLQWS